MMDIKRVHEVEEMGGFTYRGFKVVPVGSPLPEGRVYRMLPQSTLAKASAKVAGLEFGESGFALGKATVTAWADRLLSVRSEPVGGSFEVTETNLREEAKAQVLAAVNDAVEGMRDGLREFLLYPEMEDAPEGVAAVAGYMQDWSAGIEVGSIDTPLSTQDRKEFRVGWYCPDWHRNATAVGEATMKDGDLVSNVGGSWEDCQVCGLAPDQSELMRIQRDVYAQLNARSRRQSDS